MKKLLLVLALSIACTVQAREYIKNYHTDITIEKNGTLRVKETITVNSEMRNIRQGIYRDFPTHYKPFVFRTIVPFTPKRASRNGIALPLEVVSIKRGKRVYMRDGASLNPDVYTFELEYTTGRQIGFFDRHDELYWNVVGGDWMFRVDHASATVHLPENVAADQIKYTAYAGKLGSGHKAFKVNIIDAHTLEFFCTKKLSAYQAFSIVVGMPKGTITPPTYWQTVYWALLDNLDWVVLFLLLVLCSVYGCIQIYKVRSKDPKNPIIPRFRPPRDFTPGMVNYFVNRKMTPEGFAADIVNMGVYQWLTIAQKDSLMGWSKTYELKEKAKQAEPALYRDAWAKLFSKGSKLVLSGSNQKQSYEAFSKLESRYANLIKRCYFIDGSLSTILFTFAGPLILILLSMVLYSNIPVCLFVLFNLAFGSLVYNLTCTYTKRGFEVRDHIEGFKMYLKTAEVLRFKYISTPPERTPELYEKYLPYAMALGVEEEWTDSFTPIFKRLEQAGTPYHPVWYHGNGRIYTVGNGRGSFVSGLGSSLSSSVRASVPGGRSGFGSGGGGGAGGGGGGGGGGGC